MPKLSLRQAATAASVSKSTILRAIQTGRLSATRLETGGYDIDPAELFRVYPAPMRTAEMGQDAPSETAGATHATPVAHELQIRMAQLEAELSALKELNAELRTDRDPWHDQASRLTCALPAPQSTPERRGWWKRLAG